MRSPQTPPITPFPPPLPPSHLFSRILFPPPPSDFLNLLSFSLNIIFWSLSKKNNPSCLAEECVFRTSSSPPLSASFSFPPPPPIPSHTSRRSTPHPTPPRRVRGHSTLLVKSDLAFFSATVGAKVTGQGGGWGDGRGKKQGAFAVRSVAHDCCCGHSAAKVACPAARLCPPFLQLPFSSSSSFTLPPPFTFLPTPSAPLHVRGLKKQTRTAIVCVCVVCVCARFFIFHGGFPPVENTHTHARTTRNKAKALHPHPPTLTLTLPRSPLPPTQPRPTPPSPVLLLPPPPPPPLLSSLFLLLVPFYLVLHTVVMSPPPHD